MYALSESILVPICEYRAEMYLLYLNEFDEEVNINLKIFGKGEHESYIAEYSISVDEDKEISGACLNRKTKEETILAVEEAVITALMKKYGKE